MGARNSFSRWGNVNGAYSFGSFATGLLAGSTSRRQAQPIPCEMAFIQADPDNTGKIWFGGPDVSSNLGFQLDAGDATGWIPINNLNLIYYVCENASDRLLYMIVK